MHHVRDRTSKLEIDSAPYARNYHAVVWRRRCRGKFSPPFQDAMYNNPGIYRVWPHGGTSACNRFSDCCSSSTSSPRRSARTLTDGGTRAARILANTFSVTSSSLGSTSAVSDARVRTKLYIAFSRPMTTVLSCIAKRVVLGRPSFLPVTDSTLRTYAMMVDAKMNKPPERVASILTSISEYHGLASVGLLVKVSVMHMRMSSVTSLWLIVCSRMMLFRFGLKIGLELMCVSGHDVRMNLTVVVQLRVEMTWRSICTPFSPLHSSRASTTDTIGLGNEESLASGFWSKGAIWPLIGLSAASSSVSSSIASSAAKHGNFRASAVARVGIMLRASVCSATLAVREQKKAPPNKTLGSFYSMRHRVMAIDVWPVPARPVSQKMRIGSS